MAATVDEKLLRQTKFPIEFNQKVDMKKVNVEVLKKWIAGKISEILGNDDDIVTELCFNLLEGSRFPEIKKLQIQLTGFLEKDTPKFCKELWKLCLSAQSNAQGVPKELLEAKKLELIQEKIDAEKAAEEGRKRMQSAQTRERDIDSIRDRERGERRGRGDGRRGGRGGRPGREFDRHGTPREYSRSPPPRRRMSPPPDSYRMEPRGRVDTYIPMRDRGERRRSRSWSNSRSPSRSRSRSSTSDRRARKPGHQSRNRRSTIRSRSRSRPRRPRRSTSRHRGRDHHRGSYRRRSSSPSSETSRSRSPGRRHKRRSHSRSLSRSRSPIRPKYRQYHNDSRSPSPRRSMPSRRDRTENYGRLRRSPSITSESDDRHADTRKGYPRDSRRRRDLSPLRSRSLSRRSHTRRRRRSPSGSRSPERARKRPRSRERSESSRRYRSTSSHSNPSRSRERKSEFVQNDKALKKSLAEDVSMRDGEESERNPQSAEQLKLALLRECVIRERKARTMGKGKS